MASAMRLTEDIVEELRKEVRDLRAEQVLFSKMQNKRIKADLKKLNQADSVNKSFVEKCFAVAVAKVLADTVNAFVLAIWQKQQLAEGELLLERTLYAIVVTAFLTPVLWRLRGAATQGFTFVKDSSKLLKACLPIVIAWSWKDVVSSIVSVLSENATFGPTLGWNCLVAGVYTTLVVAYMSIPSVHSAKLAIAEGGESDTLLARFAVFPGTQFLALGFAWNGIFNEMITEVTNHYEDEASIQFFFQLGYYVIVSGAVTWLTARWSDRTDAMEGQSQDAEADGDDDEDFDAEESVLEMQRRAGELVIRSLSFVNAWALSNTLNLLFFNLMLDCSSATACTYQSNGAFSLALTIVFAQLTIIVARQERKSSWGKATQDLNLTQMSLTVGWAWTNFFSTVISESTDAFKASHALSYTIIFFGMTFTALLFYRSFMKQRRLFLRQSMDELKDMKIKLSDIGTSPTKPGLESEARKV